MSEQKVGTYVTAHTCTGMRLSGPTVWGPMGQCQWYHEQHKSLSQSSLGNLMRCLERALCSHPTPSPSLCPILPSEAVCLHKPGSAKTADPLNMQLPWTCSPD